MKTITTVEVQEKLAAGEKLNLIDVREVEEVEADKIPGITHIPLGLLEFRMNELDKKVPYIMVCRSGGRSGQATAFLEQQGFDVANMNGGMLNWTGEVE
ncbi:rhodanese-like domain-containing protein [Kurthia zopfii]|uniref:Probable adenylyltransferase/sulfurtransferase MoeZ n=1 Tax=Kurthia zopfii TaxID=1650 RepID=A0A2U3ABK8_9BACL|nr:rhodanese-like domain-containing protein [Kurthia zopfii]PWI21910.1 rhodanese [Kurthia zopfii]TDR36282.1 rhodanese-related sulfurtransferase [Kurthia zopfii]STX10319.1 Probable adenylyltransferase/sulfurtransferase MoeZ [Kurthia zopfii]VEI08435.1 Probable adenylyltransferase/sulfurtransferase MoeZ [Kurthia zopfii]GEK31799.1 rhodanese-like domain-containing protein [Kurthia zopfii]